MGVNNLFQNITPVAKNVTIKKFTKFGIHKHAIDMSAIIHQFFKGCSDIRVDSSGNKTNHLGGIVNLISLLYDAGITKIIGVFDNPVESIWKRGECAKRRTVRTKIEQKLGDEEDVEARHKMEKQLFTMTDDIVRDAQHLLTLLGVDWVVAPVNYEAEHVAANLQCTGIIDAIITHDSDTIVSGGTILRKQSGCSKYDIYRLNAVLVEHGLTHDELIDASLHMGNDFTNGTHGIGFKTYLKQKKTLKLTEEQKKIKEYMTSAIPTPEIEVAGSFDHRAMFTWLTKKRNLSSTKVKKYITRMSGAKIDTKPYSARCVPGAKWILNNVKEDVESKNDSEDEGDLSELSDVSESD